MHGALTDAVKAQCLSAANTVTREYKDQRPPFSVERLFAHFGVSEIRERPIDCDARLVFQTGRLVIEVNSLSPRNRRRLSIAHELGHVLLNQFTGRDALCSDHSDPVSESFCDRLAGELLAPDWAIHRYFQENPPLARWQQTVRCSTILSAAKAFEISVDALMCRVLHDLALAPATVGLVWRYSRNTKGTDLNSEPVLRLASAWQSSMHFGFIPINKTAPPNSVITKAFLQNGILGCFEELHLGRLKGKFFVEATGFGSQSPQHTCASSRAVLSLLAA
jgi:IrrE N-terminal-like domain